MKFFWNSNIINAVVLVGVVGLLAQCNYLESRALKLAIEQQNCDQGKKIMLNALKKNLNNKVAKFNLIHTFLCSGDIPSALKQIDSLLLEQTGFEYELYYLKGFLLGETGEINEALASYQKALDLNQDVKIKQNMELLLKQQSSGKGGKGKKGKGKNQDQSQSEKNSEGKNEDPQRQSDQENSEPQNNKDPKNNQSKKMSQKQIQKIMKEIDGDEKKIRSQGLKIKTKKGNDSSDKDW